MAQLSSQLIGLPYREEKATSTLSSPKLTTWLPLISILLGIASLFHLVQMSDVTSTGYNIQALQSDVADLEARNEQLALEVAKAKSLAVIEGEATRRLGMVRPNEIVYLNPSNDMLALRASPTGRGENRAVLEMEKPEPKPSQNPFQVIQQALASALAPRQPR